LGRYEEAIEAYNEAIKIDPQFAFAWNNKGLALSSLGRYEEAEQCFQRAIEFD
jgi:tetratricopeptide (TPR) repeat protein